MKKNIDVNTVLQRLYLATNTRNPTQLSHALGVSTSTFHNQIKNDDLPYREIIELCRGHHISINWIFDNLQRGVDRGHTGS